MKKILLVDDEEYVLNDLKQTIDWKGLGIGRVFLSQSVKDALNIYNVYDPDIVISDIEMIGESGLVLLEKIRKLNSDVRFVFLTCHPDFEYVRRALQLGSCDYLLKPVDYQELEELVRNLLFEKEKSQRDLAVDGMAIGLVDSVKQFIESHLVDINKVGDIADALGVSESTLAHQFKKETNWSVTEYINKTKLSTASQLLKNTDWSIGMISDMSGFSDVSYFSKVFKKLTNLSPSEYRKAHRN